MGKLSDRNHSARRPGRRERVRAKKSFRGQTWGSVGGAGTFHIKAGRKKSGKVYAFVNRAMDAHLVGESLTVKDWRGVRRPLYTITLSSPNKSATVGATPGAT